MAEYAILARVTGVNKATIELFGADNQDDLLANIDRVLTEKSLDAFREELIRLAAGGQRARTLAINKTLSGREIEVLVN